MIARRLSADRGLTRLEWLESRHTFSFGDYHDPRFMGFRVLRVLNEDRVAPHSGFSPHFHRDMEILTVVLEGTLRHEDSTGASHDLGPGVVQRMTAGSGIVHSEINPSPVDPVHFLQIWILPERRGLSPAYEERPFAAGGEGESLAVLASPDAREGSVRIHQDATVYWARFPPGGRLVHTLDEGRYAWVQIAAGALDLGGVRLEAGDAAGILEEREVSIEATGAGADLLLFDLA